MKTFAVLLMMKDPEKSAAVRPAHLAYLEKLENEGHIRAKGRFADGAGGLVIYETASYEECEALVRQDPYILEDARSYEIHEWEVSWSGR